MAKIIIDQLTNNPEIGGKEGESFEFDTTTVNSDVLLEEILSFDKKKLARNVSLVEADTGHLVLSFLWKGEYEGVCVFSVLVLAGQ